jgi:hypothetical protein
MCNYFGKTIISNLHKTSDEVSDSGYFVFADLAVPVKRKVSPEAMVQLHIARSNVPAY